MRLLRPTAQIFKSYLDILETPFPNHHPHEFLEWLDDHLSVPLPREHFDRFKPRYPNLEALLTAIERNFPQFGFEIGTSSGTSGRATIMVRDKTGADQAVESYQMAVYHLWGTKDDHQIIFVMPEETRIVMAWVARMGSERLGMDEQVHFTIPFSATPDQVRVRTGRTFQRGARGWIERRILNPFMNWMYEHYVESAFVGRTISLLERAADSQTDVLLFGGWIQLHALYQGLQGRGNGTGGKTLKLTPASMIGTGGGSRSSIPLHPLKSAPISPRYCKTLRASRSPTAMSTAWLKPIGPPRSANRRITTCRLGYSPSSWTKTTKSSANPMAPACWLFSIPSPGETFSPASSKPQTASG